MSIKALNWAFQNFETDSSQVKMIMLAIADHINDELGFAWASQQRIAKIACCSTSTVKRAVTMFEDHNILSVERKAAGKHKTLNRYRLNTSKKVILLTKAKPIKCTFEGSTVNPSKTQQPDSQSTQGQEPGENNEQLTVNPSNSEESSLSPLNSSQGAHQSVEGLTGEPFKELTAMSSYQVKEPLNNNNKITTGQHFALPSDWQPTALAFELIEHRGIPLVFARDSIAEFVLYWRGRPDVKTHSGAWDQKFYKHCIHQWERFRTELNRPDPVPMTPDWLPDDEMVTELRMQQGIDHEFIAECIKSFRRYWLEAEGVSFAWNSKFHDRVVLLWRDRQGATVGDVISRLTDRSWADVSLAS